MTTSLRAAATRILPPAGLRRLVHTQPQVSSPLAFGLRLAVFLAQVWGLTLYIIRIYHIIGMNTYR